jgi:hypothetical protein
MYTERERTHKRTATDLWMKMRMICKCKGGQNLSAFVRELDLVVSAMNAAVKDAAHDKEHVKRMAEKKSMIITEKHIGAIHEEQKTVNDVDESSDTETCSTNPTYIKIDLCKELWNRLIA